MATRLLRPTLMPRSRATYLGTNLAPFSGVDFVLQHKRERADLRHVDRSDRVGNGQSRHPPGGRYRIESTRPSASSVSSTVSNAVVSHLDRAPPALIAMTTAAIDTLSDASQRL